MTKLPPSTPGLSRTSVAFPMGGRPVAATVALSIFAGSAWGLDLGAPTPVQVKGKVLQVEAPGLASPGWFDVTGDGKPDLVVGQHANGAVFVYSSNGKGELAKARPVKAKKKPVRIPGVCEVPADFGASVHLTDLDGDGRPDLLCGSNMDVAGGTIQGHMYALMGKGKGFDKPKILQGNAGRPLAMGAGAANPLANTASVPTTVDIDGDGHLDIVSGNTEGTFYLFKGLGKGSFEQQPSALKGSDGPLKVMMNSSPAFVDWDGDGDQDLLSGSGLGGVYLFANTGTLEAPLFAESVTLVEMPAFSLMPPMGLPKVLGPGVHTRVWAGDRNGDGKPDLLVGDKTTLAIPARGVSDERATEAYQAFTAALADLAKSAPNSAVDPNAATKWMAKVKALEKTRDKVVRKVETGLVWEIFQQ